jgi:hypothetical protein
MLNGDTVDEVVVVLVVVGLVVVVVVVVGLVVVVVVVVVGHDPMSHAFTPKGLLDGSQISFALVFYPPNIIWVFYLTLYFRSVPKDFFLSPIDTDKIHYQHAQKTWNELKYC